MTVTQTQRYAYEPNHDGTYSITDTLNGECVGITPDEASAKASVQRLCAIRLANEIRLGRAAIKREIRSARTYELSRETCAAVLEDNPAELASMRVEVLLECIRWHGPVRRRRTLKLAGCSNVKLVGQLTARQRALLVAALRMDTDELRVEVLEVPS